MHEFLLQLMTGAVLDDTVIKVYDHHDLRGDCVILLHNYVPVMLRDADAYSYRKWASQLTPEPERSMLPVWH